MEVNFRASSNSKVPLASMSFFLEKNECMHSSNHSVKLLCQQKIVTNGLPPKGKLQAFDTSKIDKQSNSCGWQRQNMDSKVNTTQSSRIE